MHQLKIFSGLPNEVEGEFNDWIGDGDANCMLMKVACTMDTINLLVFYEEVGDFCG